MAITSRPAPAGEVPPGPLRQAERRRPAVPLSVLVLVLPGAIGGLRLILALPLLLVALLSAAAAAGSGAAAAGAAVVGSYLVQTHLATVPTVLSLFVAAVAVRLAVRVPGRPAARRRLTVGLGTTVALAVLW